ncbi:MAG TPA: exo 1,3/1,4-beta-D-glucan glucohydrolase [Thermoanaerobaculia bacterium]|nr:exo 1,3/1,4-beta-D-glucan glucohydrolase [Thermoanaerobaculia bacterium]
MVHPEAWPQPARALEPDADLEAAVDELLGRMTLEEKVGQLIQPEINSVTPEEVEEYRLGSVLNGGGGWPGANRHATPADWLALADAFWEASMDVPEGRPAIPILWGLDAVHGHNNVIGATLVPHNVGLGAANDPDLMREIGRLTAREVAVTGQDWNFGPTVAVARDLRWGRAYESYSENPELVASYAAAMVEGLQGEAGSEQFLDGEHLIATAKHFLGDGGTERGLDQGDNRSSEEELRDVHGAGYVAAIEAGVQTVMASFSSWRGTKMHGHRGLLTGVLKERMGFDGILVGDWNAHGQVEGCTNESCPQAINAGIDIFMVPQDWKALYENTLAQARAGEIPAERIDDAVRRVLRVKMRAGLFERGKPSSRPLGGRFELLGSEEHRAVARRAVRESLVLLKNNGGLLPLSPNERVLVAGDGADDIGKQSGGWTVTWQGTGTTDEDFPGGTSIWDGIREVVAAAGGVAVLSEDGGFDATPDVAIVVYGEDPYAEFQGDRDSLDYAPGDDDDLELLRRLQEAGVPVVSVFLTGRPLWVNPELNASDAFVVAWLPGTEGGGVAEVLFADADGAPRHDFRGRLPFSWPKRPDQAVLHRGMEGYDPLFPYGYGLTYGDESELDELSEDAGQLATTSRTTYFDGGPVAPWRLFVGDAQDPQVPVESAVVTTRGSENLVVRTVDRELQEDAREAVWSGAGRAAVFLSGREPIDLSREANGEMALSFDVRVDRAPSSAVTLAMTCGEDCSGVVDVAQALAELPSGEWGNVAVRLRCFADAGADMRRIERPFSLTSDGALALRFANVRLVSATENEASCP